MLREPAHAQGRLELSGANRLLPKTCFAPLGLKLAKVYKHFSGHEGMSFGTFSLVMPTGSSTITRPWPINSCLVFKMISRTE